MTKLEIMATVAAPADGRENYPFAKHRTHSHTVAHFCSSVRLQICLVSLKSALENGM